MKALQKEDSQGLRKRPIADLRGEVMRDWESRNSEESDESDDIEEGLMEDTADTRPPDPLGSLQ